MKNIEKMKKDFVTLCEQKRKSKNAKISDISKKMNIEKESLEKFFKIKTMLQLEQY